MNSTQLEYFLETVRQGNISRAAKIKFVTQPAISKQISAMEKELGCRLLEKHGKTVTPTPHGRFVLECAEAVQGNIERMKENITASRNEISGNVRIACGAVMARVVMPKIVLDCLKPHSGLQITIIEANSADMPELLLRDAVDLIVGNCPDIDDESIVKRLFTSRLVTIFAKNHPLAKRKGKITPSVAGRYAFVGFTRDSQPRILIDKFLAGKNEPLRCAIQGYQTETLLPYVKCGLGIAIVSDYILKLLKPDGIASCELSPVIPFPVNIYSSRNRYISPACKFVRDRIICTIAASAIVDAKTT